MGMTNRLHKAQMSGLGMLIIILVSAILLFTVAKIMIAKFSDAGEKSACTLSLTTRALSKSLGSSSLKVECPIDTITFHQNNWEVWGSTDGKDYGTKKYTSNGISADEIHSLIAQESASCWQKTGKGEIDFFNKHVVGWDLKHACFICTTFSFTDDVRQPTFEGFDAYAKQHKVPSPTVSEDFFSYLTNGKERGSLLITWEGQKPIRYSAFSKRTSYAILVIGSVPAWWGSNDVFLLGSMLDGVSSRYDFMISPLDKVAETCQVLVN
ncbi:hypothetical protein HZB02_03125 [Candidatus Woesearchaeota archaeon]|nr:hypothetical protein [Candidatus Woesearchaeota archaeon]